MKYDGTVDIVTGGGAGLGRIYCKDFAKRGAKVVVNDMNAKAANAVVDEIKAMGGEAVPSVFSVVDGEKVIASAVDAFGTVHIIVNNAGVLRDVSFAKQTREQWDLVVNVHLNGTMAMCKAAWKIMNTQKYGRIINVTSVNGLYGQFGQSNYSAAKMGIVGFSKTLAMEGKKNGIKVNVVAPGAGTAMTATVMPKQIVENWKPEYVSPIVQYLAHEECPVSGGIFESGGGWCAQVKWSRTQGHYFDVDNGFTLEDMKANFSKVTDFKGADFPDDTHLAAGRNPMLNKQLTQILKKMQAAAKKKSKL
jgi:NAD(P)-dependent dehydrogenase (short-subunit alcohol dehydrogenase family)